MTMLLVVPDVFPCLYDTPQTDLGPIYLSLLTCALSGPRVSSVSSAVYWAVPTEQLCYVCYMCCVDRFALLLKKLCVFLCFCVSTRVLRVAFALFAFPSRRSLSILFSLSSHCLPFSASSPFWLCRYVLLLVFSLSAWHQLSLCCSVLSWLSVRSQQVLQVLLCP